MDLAFDSLAGAALIVVFAYAVVGMTGFGASMTAMPLLVHLMPLRTALPMMLVFDLCASALLGASNRHAIERRELLRLVPFMLMGVVAGVTVLVKAPERVLLLVLGLFVLANAAWSLFGRIGTQPIAPGWAVPLGLVGGVFSALFGSGGPVYTIYLARRITDKSRLRATVTTLIFLSASTRLVSFLAAGLFAQRELLILIPLLAPCALTGLFLGNRLHHRLPAQRVIQLVWTLLFVGGLTLVWRNL